jgi:hypothetical protein
MMTKSLYATLTCMVALILLPLAANAGSMRCGPHLIQDGKRNGPSKYEVLKKCGEPTEKGWDTWVYDKPGKAAYSIKFSANGNLIVIRKL